MRMIWWDDVVGISLSKSQPDTFYVCSISNEKIEEKTLGKKKKKNILGEEQCHYLNYKL